jgi:hypothetical protein
MPHWLMPLSYVANNRSWRGAGGGVEAPTPPPPDLPRIGLHDELFMRRRALLAEVARLARDVGAAIRAAREINLPVEPGTAAARQTLVAWAHLLEGLLGTDHTGPSSRGGKEVG